MVRAFGPNFFTWLPKLIKFVESGEDVFITRRGERVVQLHPVLKPKPRFGTLKGLVGPISDSSLFAMSDAEADDFLVILLATAPQRVAARIRKIVSDAERRYVSVVSFIEVALKHRKDPAAFPFPVEILAKALSDLYALELPVRSSHAVRIERLPMRHRDPFDHLLMAQAIEERIPLVTMDTSVAAYAEDGLTVIGKR